MAKAKTESTQSAEPASAEDLAIARRAIQDITGCGEPEAHARATALDAATIAKIAELDRADDRKSIRPLIF